MNALGKRSAPNTHTSAIGSMYRPSRDTTIAAAILIVGGLSSPATASTTHEIPHFFERTAAAPAGQIAHLSEESTAEAILEIRRRSGLTWEELSDLFDVSRRSVHHWASGKSVSAKHDQAIRRILTAIRHLDQGSQAGTRALLMAINDTTGFSTLDLLKDGRFDEVIAGRESVRAPEYRRVPLSRKAENTHRPPQPVLLIEAEQERPDVQANARAARPLRPPK